MLVDGTIPNSENATVANSPTSTLQETTPISGAGAAAPSPTAFVWRALPPFDYGRQKVRGVNLGGWFMMEVRVFWYLSGFMTYDLLYGHLLLALQFPSALFSHYLRFAPYPMGNA